MVFIIFARWVWNTIISDGRLVRGLETEGVQTIRVLKAGFHFFKDIALEPFVGSFGCTVVHHF